MRISDWSSDVCSSDLLLGMALVVACAAIPADHGALHVRRADLLGARHQRRDAMPGVALWIIAVDADQSDQRIAILMLVPRGREQPLALGNRRIIVLPDPNRKSVV